MPDFENPWRPHLSANKVNWLRPSYRAIERQQFSSWQECGPPRAEQATQEVVPESACYMKEELMSFRAVVVAGIAAVIAAVSVASAAGRDAQQPATWAETLTSAGITGIEAQTLTSALQGRPKGEGEEIFREYIVLKAAGLAVDQALAIATVVVAERQRVLIVAQQEQAEKKFLGIDWSLGIFASFDFGSDMRVDDAEVINGVVRVTDESSVSLGLALDAHYFWPVHKNTDGKAMVGSGPFLAIQTSGEDVIDSWALGAMVGLRRDPNSAISFNLGLGLRVEPGVKTLGDGIEENKPLPEGETEIRFKETDMTGIVVMFSASF